MLKGVRLSRTSYSWPRKFDSVEENKLELLRTAGTTRLGSTLLSSGNRCKVTVYVEELLNERRRQNIEVVEQDMRRFRYYPRRND